VTGTLASVVEVQDYFVKMQDSDAEAQGSFVEMRETHTHTVAFIVVVQGSFVKEPYKRDNILQKRPIILSILLTEDTGL